MEVSKQILNRPDRDIAINYLQQHKKAEPVVCSTFGCGKRLSISEQLFGNKCIQCSKQVKKTEIVIKNV